MIGNVRSSRMMLWTPARLYTALQWAKNVDA